MSKAFVAKHERACTISTEDYNRRRASEQEGRIYTRNYRMLLIKSNNPEPVALALSSMISGFSCLSLRNAISLERESIFCKF